jgi:hypothetical protein
MKATLTTTDTTRPARVKGYYKGFAIAYGE